MTSVERVHFYSTKLPQEKDKLQRLPFSGFSSDSKNWPSSGLFYFIIQIVIFFTVFRFSFV
jgi:hypothetical protein